ncbi:MAG: hypothetical protein Q4P13_10855 [Psychrobacter sp.]|nr:hypothetical protein [Psychrobacter sp.]
MALIPIMTGCEGMRKILLLVSSLLISSASFSMGFQTSGNTTCHVYHQGKLLKTLNCASDTYAGSSGRTYGFEQTTYTLPGFGVMTTYYDIGLSEAKDPWRDAKFTLNDEPAVFRYRDYKSKKVVSESYAKKHKVLRCYLSKKSQWEICSED